MHTQERHIHRAGQHSFVYRLFRPLLCFYIKCWPAGGEDEERALAFSSCFSCDMMMDGRRPVGEAARSAHAGISGRVGVGIGVISSVSKFFTDECMALYNLVHPSTSSPMKQERCRDKNGSALSNCSSTLRCCWNGWDDLLAPSRRTTTTFFFLLPSGKRSFISDSHPLYLSRQRERKRGNIY